MKIDMKKTDAYFTVEAAMVLPIVIGVILMIIYLWFFQYNRCLMEQDTAILALRGSILQVSEKEEVFSFVQTQYEQNNKEKYLIWNMKTPSIKLEKDIIRVYQKGDLYFPFGGWNFWGEDNEWGIEAVYENHREFPVSIIRTWRKIKGGNKDVTDGIY